MENSDTNDYLEYTKTITPRKEVSRIFLKAAGGRRQGGCLLLPAAFLKIFLNSLKVS